MSKQVPWTRSILDEFIREAMLNEDEIYIMETRVRGIPVSQQAMHLNKSESTVHQMIATLKRKYDACQKHHPDTMPLRKNSKAEMLMDEN